MQTRQVVLRERCAPVAVFARRRRFLLGAIATAGLGIPSLAMGGVVITSPGSVSTSGATVAECTPVKLFDATAGIISSDSCTFKARFKQIMGFDRSVAGGTDTFPHSSTHVVNFGITAGASDTWEATIIHRRKGRVLINQEGQIGGKCAWGLLEPITVIATGPGALNQSLNTGTNYGVCNCNQSGDCSGCTGCDLTGDGDDDASKLVDESKTAILGGGIGSGSVALTFTWDSTLKAISSVAGSDEAVISLGESANDVNNIDPCVNNRLDAAWNDYYTPEADDGHIVTVTLVDTSGTAGFTIDSSVFCGNTGFPNCIYTTEGTVGCVGQNYNLNFTYTIDNNSPCTDFLPVTNGNHQWSKSTVCPCGANSSVAVTLTDKPGYLGHGTAEAPLFVNRVVEAQVDPCSCTTDADCPNTGERCNPTTGLCVAASGACCDTLNGVCTEGILAADCVGDQRVWTKDATCADVVCDPAPGACCDQDVFGTCTVTTVMACDCKKCVWHKLLTCEDIECLHNAIPTVSQWGLVVLVLLLLIGAKIYFGRRETVTAL